MTFLFLLVLPFLGQQPDPQPEMSTGYQEREAVYGKTMMVASANPIASQVGFAILEQGGNAIDAAIAMQMVLTLVEPQSSGLGGGGMLLYYSKKEGKVIAYDGRETAPAGSETSRVPEIVGGQSVGTPGVLKMLDMVHQEHGALPWKELFEPAIHLAQNGFPLSSRLHDLVQQSPHLSSSRAAREYLFGHGKAKPVGTLIKNTALADTLRLLAREGTYPFYNGEIAQDIVHTVQETPIRPGKLALEDLEHYQPIKRQPIETSYRGYRIFGFPPPSAGGIAVAQILGMLEGTDMSRYTLGSPSFINLFCKASRAAYAERQLYMGDPAFTHIPITHLLNQEYLRHLLQHPTKTPISASEHPSTSQICVVDQEGNAVSFTTSIEYAFGSTLMVRGFFLNNQLTDFSSGANRLEPGKRPMSSMSPTFVFKGDQLVLNVGSAGGARIIDYVAQAVLGVLDFGMNIQEAIAFPNYTSILETIDLEKGTFLQKDIQALQKMGNRVRLIFLTSGTQGIQVTAHFLIGGVDPRREGLAIGG